MATPSRFLADIAETCTRNGAPFLVKPLEAVATAALAQLVRVELDRITHVSHPIRVLNHVLLGQRDQTVTPRDITLALGLAALCHDASTVKKKSRTLVARTQDAVRQAEEEWSRRALRILHEAEGTAELVKAVQVGNQLLRAAGEEVISAECLEIAARVCAVHDTPSLGGVLPLARGTKAGDALALFVLADGITMIEFSEGLRSPVPVGPMVERWTRDEPVDASSVADQMKSSLKSLKRRLRAAFDVSDETSLRGCFALSPTLADLAVSYASKWAAELGVEFDI
jgi:hypothetical protein